MTEKYKVHRVLRRRNLTFKQRKARRRRRRIIKVWCARIIACTMLIGAIGTIILLLCGIKSLIAPNEPKVEKIALYVPTIPVSSASIEIQIDDMISRKEIEKVYEEETSEQITEEEIIEEVEQIVACISPYEPGAVYYYNLTYEEKVYIAKVVYAESRGECFEGQVAVACVILNRYYSDDPFFENDSIYSVVTQGSQFAPIDDVTDEDLAAYPNCMEAVEQACLGWDPTRQKFEEGALYFFEPNGVEGYQKEIRENIDILQIGNHYFHFDFEKVEK